MRGSAVGIISTVLLVASGHVRAQTGTAPSPQAGPIISVSPSSLDFGLVGVGRNKQLSFTVRNTGGGTLNGVATVAPPFQLSANAYSLQPGQSQAVSVQYVPTSEGTNTAAIAFSGGGSATVTLAGRARTPPKPPGQPRIVTKPGTRFQEEEQADVIIRYFSDSTSYLLKPALMDGAYRSVCDRARALEVAAQQPRRQLAVVVLIQYPAPGVEDPIKQKWSDDLRSAGYERIVFLRGTRTLQVKGLTIVEGPPPPAVSAGQ